MKEKENLPTMEKKFIFIEKLNRKIPTCKLLKNPCKNRRIVSS